VSRDEGPDAGGCLICAMEDADDAVVVARDDLWACEIVPGYEVPGWFVLRTRRHAVGLPGLTPAELAAFGPRARDAVAAVTEVTGAAATYLMSFGENYRHYHALIAARGDDVPPERRAGDILKLRTERADPDSAQRLVPAVRAAYRRQHESRR
jgi:diadenosine tetraphosphate (Ap4A) HIT family hydrolase